MLKAWVESSGADPLTCWTDNVQKGVHFTAKAVERGSTTLTARSGFGAEQALIDAGALRLADPSIAAYAWHRRSIGQQRWSSVGTTHTTASHNAMDRIGSLLTAPVQGRDALIYTSRSVHRTVKSVLDAQVDYFASRLDAILARLDAESSDLQGLFDDFPDVDRQILTTGVLWLIKFGFIAAAI